MKIFQKVKNKNIKEYLLFSYPIFKKEVLFSSKSYFLFNHLFYQKRIQANYINYYLFSKRIRRIDRNILKEILGYMGGGSKDFIYFCFHSGEVYYLLKFIKRNYEKFKNTTLIFNFNHQNVIERLDFDLNQVNIIYAPKLYFFSYAIWYKNGKVISECILEHFDGWIVNNKIQKDECYLNIKQIIENFLLADSTNDTPLTNSILNINKKDKSILLIPESQFNGCISYQTCKNLITLFKERGYKVFLNTKSNVYDDLLSKNVLKSFLSYKQTYDLALSIEAVISVRNGLLDNLQEAIYAKTNFFILYTSWHYPQYKYFYNFHEWLFNTYSFNKINNIENFMEFCNEDELVNAVAKSMEAVNV